MICMRFYHTDSLTVPYHATKYFSPTKNTIKCLGVSICLKSLEIAFLTFPISKISPDPPREKWAFGPFGKLQHVHVQL